MTVGLAIPSDQEPQQEAPETEDLQAQHSHKKQFATTADATATPQETQQGTDSDDAPYKSPLTVTNYDAGLAVIHCVWTLISQLITWCHLLVHAVRSHCTQLAGHSAPNITTHHLV